MTCVLISSCLIYWLERFFHVFSAFSTDQLFSFNGTNPTRGQVPQLVYYSSVEEQSISTTTVNIAQVMQTKETVTGLSVICYWVITIKNRDRLIL